MYLVSVKVRSSEGVKNMLKSRSKVCLISTPFIESIPNSDSAEFMLTAFKSLIPENGICFNQL